MEEDRIDILTEEKNNILTQHQSNREQWLEQCLEEHDNYLDYAFAVRENEYEQKEEKYRNWEF